MIIGRAENKNLPVLSAGWSYWILLARSICIKVKLECRLNMGIVGAFCALLGVAHTYKVRFRTCVDNGTIKCQIRYKFIRFVECTSKTRQEMARRLLRSRTNPRRSKQPKRRQKRSGVSRLAHQKSKLSAGSPKSTHHLKSHKDHRS